MTDARCLGSQRSRRGDSATSRLMTIPNMRPTPTLDPMHRLLERFGRPDRRHPIVLVAGTNGKGSTVALLESAALHHGFVVGAFVGPHLVAPHERIRIGGAAIEADRFESLARTVLETEDEPSITGFEGAVAMAHLAFAESGVDLAVVEVGIGGRWDPTNVCTPTASVITDIGIDHAAILGPTIERIAREKAGILRPHVPAWSSVSGVSAEVLRRTAEEIGTCVHFLPDDQAFAVTGVSPRGTTFTMRGPGTSPWQLTTRLVGAHQARNAWLAAQVARHLGVGHASIARGFGNVEWPGRMERIDVGRERSLWLDVAHNPAAVSAQVDALASLAVRPHLVVAVSDDKDVQEMARRWTNAVAAVVATKATTTPRALDANVVLRSFRDAGHGQVTSDVDPLHAVRALLSDASPGAHVLVSGSAFLVGSVRAAWLDGQLG